MSSAISITNIQTLEVIESVSFVGNNASDNKNTVKSINAQSMNIGVVGNNSLSETKIIKLKAPDAIVIKNIRLGLIDTGGIVFSNLLFGVETRNYYDKSLIPKNYFQGISTSSNSEYNVVVPNSNSTTSNFVYLNVFMPQETQILAGSIRFKWWFDYA